MGLTEFGSQRLIDLQWENEQLKNAIVKHFLGVDLEKRPSNQITVCCDEFSSKKKSVIICGKEQYRKQSDKLKKANVI